jgi:hypothetical protein
MEPQADHAKPAPRSMLRSSLQYAAVATPICALVFLATSSFFTSWHGRVVSRQPALTEGAEVRSVLIVSDDGTSTIQQWPTELTDDLALPFDSLLLPTKSTEGRPLSEKLSLRLHFLVKKEGEAEWREIPTWSARTLSVAAVLWGVGFLVWNMARTGSPVGREEHATELPDLHPRGLPQAPPAPNAPRRSQPGPPPPRPHRGPRG